MNLSYVVKCRVIPNSWAKIWVLIEYTATKRFYIRNQCRNESIYSLTNTVFLIPSLDLIITQNFNNNKDIPTKFVANLFFFLENVLLLRKEMAMHTVIWSVTLPVRSMTFQIIQSIVYHCLDEDCFYFQYLA